MNPMTNSSHAVERYLLEQHGLLLTGRALWKSIGFQSASAFRRAASRGALPVRTFKIEGRKGLFAYSSEVAEWIGAVGGQDTTRSKEEEDPTMREI